MCVGPRVLPKGAGPGSGRPLWAAVPAAVPAAVAALCNATTAQPGVHSALHSAQHSQQHPLQPLCTPAPLSPQVEPSTDRGFFLPIKMNVFYQLFEIQRNLGDAGAHHKPPRTQFAGSEGFAAAWADNPATTSARGGTMRL